MFGIGKKETKEKSFFELTEDMRIVNDMIGWKAKCKLTGVEGIIEGVSIPLYGINRLMISISEGENTNKMPDTYSIDHINIELLERTDLRVIPVEYSKVIPLGEEVEDEILKVKGTVIGKRFHINGCVFSEVATKEKSITGEYINQIFPDPRLKRLKEIIPQKEVQERKKTGGPSIKENNYSKL